MLERDDLLVPYYRGEPFFDKPPLTYWLMAACFRAFGMDAGAARVVPAMAALGVLLATLWLGCAPVRPADRVGRRDRAGDDRSVPGVRARGHVGHAAGALDACWRWRSRSARSAAARTRPGRSRLAAALGLGFLTKGPIALLLPGLGLAWLAWTRRASMPRTRPWIAAAGALVFAVIALGWFVAVERRLGWGPLAHFFLRENLQRFAASTYDAQRPIWYYVPTYLAEGAPWSLFLPLAAWHALRRQTSDAGSRFLLAWLALMLVPLSLSRGKIDYYLLPFYPAASLVIARFFLTVPWRVLERNWARAVLALAAVALALIPPFLAGHPEPWVPSRAVLGIVSAAFGCAVLGCTWAALRPTPGRTLPTLALAAALVIGCLGGLVVPAFYAAQPVDALVEDVRREQRYRPDATVVACSDPARAQRDLLFHARTVVEERCDLWALLSSSRPFLLILYPEEGRSLLAAEGVREVGRYRYMPAAALTLAGVLDRPAPAEMALAANFATDDPVAQAKARRDRKRALREASE